MSRPTRIVVALGGNALEDKNLPPTAESQAVVVERTAKILADISCGGYEMAVVHGNGPQVADHFGLGSSGGADAGYAL